MPDSLIIPKFEQGEELRIAKLGEGWKITVLKEAKVSVHDVIYSKSCDSAVDSELQQMIDECFKYIQTLTVRLEHHDWFNITDWIYIMDKTWLHPRTGMSAKWIGDGKWEYWPEDGETVSNVSFNDLVEEFGEKFRIVKAETDRDSYYRGQAISTYGEEAVLKREEEYEQAKKTS